MKQENVTWKCNGDVEKSHEELKRCIDNYISLGYNIITVVPTLYYADPKFPCIIKAIIIVKKNINNLNL
jgi:hypothetical protein